MYPELVLVFCNLQMFRQKALYFHWNVTGSSFYQLHLLFERVYNEVAPYEDRLAEHIRGYGRAPGLYSAYLQLSSLQEVQTVPAAPDMVANLQQDISLVRRDLDLAIKKATSLSKQGTVNLLGELAETFDVVSYLLTSQIA